MPDRQKEEQLVSLEKDALFNLLPYVIKTYDNGALKLLFRSVTSQHNFMIERFRELIRLQDPYLAGLFKPSNFGESETAYNEYSSLINRWSFLTSGQKSYARYLEDRIPNSIKAKNLESTILSALAGNVGEKTYGGKLKFGLRSLIASAVSRHHLKGSHSAAYALGLVTGVFEIAVKELWSRYSLSEPDNPSSLKNDFDFSYEPDHYPYFSPDGKYTGQKIRQYGYPSQLYNPKILDDASGLLYEETFKWCVPSITSPYWYNNIINGKNPFGRFTTEVTRRLISGRYKMSGGSDNSRAYVLIPALGGQKYLFEALSYGEWANDVTITISNNVNSTQDVTLIGPRSKIKFKSSYFDLTIGADISIYPLIYPSVPVVRNNSQSYMDEVVGRVVPEYPLTTVRNGTSYSLEVSNPEVHFQIDNRQLQELFGIVRLMFESIRPISRTARKEHFGILVRDQILYAPLFTLNEVRIRSNNGNLWELSVDSTGVPAWREVDGEPTETPIQYEKISQRSIRWSVTDDGKFLANPITQIDPLSSSTSLGNVVWRGKSNSSYLGEYVVYYRSDGFNGFVYSDNGVLRTSTTSPSIIVDTIHTDGTLTEELLKEEYTKYAENPIPGTEQYMSDDATYEEEPDQSLQFQNSPEDGVLVKPMVVDFSPFHVDAHFGTEDEIGFPGSNWWHDMDGDVVGDDIRVRSAGIAIGFIDPVPTGDQTRQDGLTYDYPIGFLNHHNIVPNRNRVTNHPYWSNYTYDSPDQYTGPTLFDTDLEEHDGPIEGSTEFGKGSEIEIPENGEGITPNYQCSGGDNGPIVDSLLLERVTRLTQICYRYVSITNHDGSAKVKTNRYNALQLGNFIYVSEAPYEGLHRITERISEYEFVVDTPYSSDIFNGYLYSKSLETHVSNAQEVTIKITREVNSSPFSAIVISRSLVSGDDTILSEVTLTNELEKVETLSVPQESILYVFSSTEAVDIITVDLPNNTLNLRGSLMFHGGDKSSPAITIIEDGEHFFDYNETGRSSYEEISGRRWWRGGNWKGETAYTIDNSDREGLPGLLVIPILSDYVITSNGSRVITATGDQVIAKLS